MYDCMACTCYGNPPISQPKTCARGCLYRGKPAQVTNLAIARFRWMNVSIMSVYMSLFRWADLPKQITQTELYNRSTFSNKVNRHHTFADIF